MAAKSTALTTGRETSLTRKPSTKDRRIWYLFRNRMTPEEIAARERVSLAVVQKAIERMEVYRALTSNEEIEMAINAAVLQLLPDSFKSLREAVKAKVVTRQMVPNKKGEFVPEVVSIEPDHSIRLQAHDRIQKMADRMIPRGGGIAVNVQQNNANNGDGGGMVSRRSFEETLRERRRERGLSDGMTTDAEYEDVENVDESADDHEDEEEAQEQ
jgi:hypothetical protein